MHNWQSITQLTDRARNAQIKWPSNIQLIDSNEAVLRVVTQPCSHKFQLLRSEQHSFHRLSQSQPGSRNRESVAPKSFVQSQFVFYRWPACTWQTQIKVTALDVTFHLVSSTFKNKRFEGSLYKPAAGLWEVFHLSSPSTGFWLKPNNSTMFANKQLGVCGWRSHLGSNGWIMQNMKYFYRKWRFFSWTVQSDEHAKHSVPLSTNFFGISRFFGISLVFQDCGLRLKK